MFSWSVVIFSGDSSFCSSTGISFSGLTALSVLKALIVSEADLESWKTREAEVLNEIKNRFYLEISLYMSLFKLKNFHFQF